jgi:hypothetical protein
MLDVTALVQFNRPFGFADDLSNVAAAGNVKPIESSVDLSWQAEQNGNFPAGNQAEGIDDVAV